MRAKSNERSRLTEALLALLVAAVAPATLYAQGCPLCYQTAASSSANFLQALKGGIFVLIVPSFIICTAVTIITYRKRNVCDEDEPSRGE